MSPERVETRLDKTETSVTAPFFSILVLPDPTQNHFKLTSSFASSCPTTLSHCPSPAASASLELASRPASWRGSLASSVPRSSTLLLLLLASVFVSLKVVRGAGAVLTLVRATLRPVHQVLRCRAPHHATPRRGHLGGTLGLGLYRHAGDVHGRESARPEPPGSTGLRRGDDVRHRAVLFWPGHPYRRQAQKD